jgi:glutamine cyclotransferase
VYDAKTFKQLREFPFNDDGWGMTSDGKHLIISTGSSNIYYLTPDSLSFVKKVEVQDNNGYVGSINELEYIDGFIYANKWLTSEILKIDPNTGRVVAKLDLSKQTADAKSKFPGAQEMNGIAYDSTTGKTYVTGKKWPLIYEIKW